jgi:sec-independent protein translocase protein TatC
VSFETEEDLKSKPFLDHLGDLRSCIVRALGGFGAIYAACVYFALPLWGWIHAPLQRVLEQAGANEVAMTISEEWSVLYLSAPLVASLFFSAPWIAYQLWTFVAPGLYTRERRWTAGFLISFAVLFLAGGAFGYYVVLPSSLAFLLGIGRPLDIVRFVTIDSYFSAFVNVMLGSTLSFEAPLVVLFLTLTGIVTPAFLWHNVRYAILAGALIASLVTPSTNPVDTAMVAIPLLSLFLAGLIASSLVHRLRQRSV